MMQFEVGNGGFKPKPKGRKAGAKNRNQQQRNEAVALATVKFEAGMSKIEAARAVSEEMKLPMEAATLARLIPSD